MFHVMTRSFTHIAGQCTLSWITYPPCLKKCCRQGWRHSCHQSRLPQSRAVRLKQPNSSPQYAFPLRSTAFHSSGPALMDEFRVSVSGPETYSRKRKTLTQACERCHERKIRCIAGKENFAPPAKLDVSNLISFQGDSTDGIPCRVSTAIA